MALIVEDGTMAQGANAYCSVDFADGYLSDRGLADWPLGSTDIAAKTASVIKAADYLNGLRWYGKKAKAVAPRVMAWPRTEAEDRDGEIIGENVIPYAVQAANAYLARLVYIGTDLQPILERGGAIQSEKVGNLSTSYFESAANRDIYAGVADLLSGLCSDFENYAGAAATAGKNGKITYHTVRH
jgi:hypothetical protein